MNPRYLIGIGCLAWVCVHAGGPAQSQDTIQNLGVNLVAKALGGTGSNVNGLKGENIRGGALDLGIEPPSWKNLSLELATAYAERTGIYSGSDPTAGGEEALTFHGLGFSLIYTHHFDGFSLVGKSGLAYERERIENPGNYTETTEDTSFIYAAGIEFPLPGQVGLAVEIEGSTGLPYTAGFEFPLPGQLGLVVEIEGVANESLKGADLVLGLNVPLR